MSYIIEYFEKVEVTRKDTAQVEAESKEKAKEKFLAGEYDWLDGETLHGTATVIDDSLEIESIIETE